MAWMIIGVVMVVDVFGVRVRAVLGLGGSGQEGRRAVEGRETYFVICVGLCTLPCKIGDVNEMLMRSGECGNGRDRRTERQVPVRAKEQRTGNRQVRGSLPSPEYSSSPSWHTSVL